MICIYDFFFVFNWFFNCVVVVVVVGEEEEEEMNVSYVLVYLVEDFFLVIVMLVENYLLCVRMDDIEGMFGILFGVVFCFF